MDSAAELSELLILRLDECRWSSTLEQTLGELSPAGLIFSKPLGSAAPTFEALARISDRMDSPVLLALEEGGGLHPAGGLLPALPPARLVGLRGGRAATRMGGLIGRALAQLGLNLILGPALDLASRADREDSEDAAFSSDPRIVAECGDGFIRGVQQWHVFSCPKHFPGLGSVQFDSATGQGISARPMADLWRHDLAPFREALSATHLLMASEAIYKAYDFKQPQPAALSERVLEGLLRVKMRFEGVVLSSDLERLAREMRIDIGAAAVRAVNAGCDIALIRERSAATVLSSFNKALELGTLSRDRVQDSLARLRRLKRKLPRPPSKFSAASFNELAREFQDFAGQCQAARGRA